MPGTSVTAGGSGGRVEDGAVEGRPGNSKAGGYFGNRDAGGFEQRSDGLDLFGGEFGWSAAPTLLLTAILADATNLGLAKMAESCPGTSPSKLSWLVAWHIRDETYSKALAGIVNHQHRLPFAAHWGEGTTASSDGQRYRAGGRGEAVGQVNAKYGNDPGVTFYTHVSDQDAPFHT